MWGRLPRKSSFAALVVFAALASPSAAMDRGETSISPRAPVFLVQPVGGDSPELGLAFSLPTTSPPPARITLYVPDGFPIYPHRPAGVPIGEAELYAVDYTAGATGSTRLHGQIFAKPIDAQAEAELQACGPRPHLASWELSLNLLGQQLAIPIAISRPDGQRAGELRLDLCPPALAPGRTLLPITSFELWLWEIVVPRTRGDYVWRLEVTPAAPDRMTPLPEQTFELRSLTPVPQSLTLRGRYRAAARRVELRGTLREAGKPVARARVQIIKLVREVTPRGVVFKDELLGIARTNKTGAYTFSAPLRRTAGFVSATELRFVRCADRGVTPAGCLSQTIPAAASEPITVSVGRARPRAVERE